jgi:hypothetical protein
MCLQDDADDERGVPTSPYISREVGLQVGLRREQLPNRVLYICSPCAQHQQVPRSTSRVVPGAHRVVGPCTHQSSGPKDVHTSMRKQLWEKQKPIWLEVL